MINLKLKDGSIREIEENSIYKQGDDFIDLCRDPHLLSTKGIKGFKLTSIAGAYWRGNEKIKCFKEYME